jgi:tRNA(adenine34) deaminase
MQQALVQAALAASRNEVPVGAIVVHDGIILCAAHNQVETAQDATAHAEMLCIQAAAKQLGAPLRAPESSM